MSTSSGTILYHMLPTDAWSLPAQPGNPTLALGVKESRKVLEPILDVKKRGVPVVLISQKPHVFEVADRIHIHRLGRRIAVINPAEYTMSDAVAIMTGAMRPKAA
jgi:fructose transport system ATP-binding protein